MNLKNKSVMIRRLSCGDERLARELFATMAAVFEENTDDGLLELEYVRSLLARRDFFAVAALEGDTAVGGITAHVLPMTRSADAELFIYDLAVRADRQRQGIGRQLLSALRAFAAAEGVATSFVPADNEDTHALEFYRACGGTESPVTIFTFE